MKNKARELLCHVATIFSLTVLPGCRKDTTHVVNNRLSIAGTPDNLLIDDNWSASAPNIITGQKDGNFQFSANGPAAWYVYQTISVDSQQFYSAEVSASYKINNYYSCGLYIMDSSRQNILAKFERTNSSGSEDTWKVVFLSKQRCRISVVMGFLNGINASVTFQNPSLTACEYQPVISGSDFSAHLSGKFPLDFSEKHFDSTVCQVADYVNSVLLCKYTYNDDTVELPVLNTLIGNNPDYSYFNQYRQLVNSLPVAYCQKSSLSTAEILNNEFHIPTRQVHMVFGPEGRHQFTEYWNPFVSKWICIDPCFNVQYTRNNTLLGVMDFDRSDAPALMTSYGSHVFYSFLPEDLPWYWQNMDSLEITDHYSITWPYAR